MSINYKTQIFDYIDEKVRTGEYKPGQKIMSENQIAIKFSCSRLTARSVLHDLVLLGILDSIKGRGYYISSWADKLLFSSISQNVKNLNKSITTANAPDFKINFKKKWSDYFGISKSEIMKNSEVFYKSFNSGKKEVIRQKMFINSSRVFGLTHDNLADSSINTIESNGIKITNHACLVTFIEDEGFKPVAEALGWKDSFPILIDVMSDDTSWLSFTIKIIRPEYFELYFAKRIL